MSFNLWRFERPKRSKHNHKWTWKRHYRNQRKRIAKRELEEWRSERDNGERDRARRNRQ